MPLDVRYQTGRFTLATDVADSGTVTVAYPSGVTADDCDIAGDHVVQNTEYGRLTSLVGEVEFAFGASSIVITNSSGITWRSGTVFEMEVDLLGDNRQVLGVGDGGTGVRRLEDLALTLPWRVYANKTVNVATDKSDFQSAFDAARGYDFEGGFRVTINGQSGQKWDSSAVSVTGDHSGVTLDAATTITAPNDFSSSDYGLEIEAGSHGMRMDAKIDMDGLGNGGIHINPGASMVFGPGAGVINAGANGDDPNGAAVLIIGGEAHVDYDAATAKGIVVDGAARRGIWVTIGGNFSGKFGSYLNVGTDPSISEGNSAVLISRNGSWYDDNVTMTGSVRGIRNGGGEAQVRDGNLSGIDGTGIWNFFYGVTKTEQTDFSETGWHGAWSVYGANYSSRLDISDQETAITSVEFDSTGYRMSIMGTVADALIEYVLVTAYDQEVGRETTTLAEGIDDSVTSFDVANAARLPSVVDFVIQIGSERMLVTGVSGNTLTVTREVDGTTAAAHSNGATVQLYGTTLNGAINDSVTSISVNDASILPPAAAGDYLLTIGSERVKVTGVSGSTLTVSRGEDGTSATTHSDNDAVSIYVKSQSVAVKEATPTGHAWGDSGDHVYIVGTSSDQVHQYSVSTAYDLTSTFAFVGSFSFSAQTGSAQAIRFNAAGTAMFIASGANIFEYTLSTGWDVTSASYTATHDFSAIVTDIRGFDFGDSGNRLFIADQDTDRLDQYELASAYTLTGFTWDKYDYLKSPGSNNGLTSRSVSGFCFPTENRFFFCGDASGTDSVFRYETWDYSVLYVGGPQGDQAQGGGVIIADRPTFDDAKWTLAEVDTPQGSIAMEDVVSATGLMGPVATITGGEVTAPGSAFYASANSKAPHMVLASDWGKFEGTGATLDGGGAVPYLVAVTEGGRAFLRGAALNDPLTKILDWRSGGGEVFLHNNRINGVENQFPNAAWLRDGAVFASRTEAALAILLGFKLANGKVFWAEGLQYVFDDTAGDPISDMPGVIPVSAEPGHFKDNTTPGTTDMSAALNSLISYCRAGRAPGRASGTYFVGSTTISDDTDGLIDWSGATLVSTYDGQTEPVFELVPASGDTFATNSPLLTAVNTIIAAGSWRRGVRALPSLSSYAGLSFRVAVSDKYIDREGGGSGDYRYDLQIEVLDSEGTLNAPLPFDIPSTVTMTTCEGHTVRERVEIGLPTVSIQSGTTDRTDSLITISRSNTTVNGGTLIDGGGAEHDATARVTKCTRVTWNNANLNRANEHGNAYGVTVNFASSITLNSLQGSGSKRQLNADYAHTITLNDPVAPDGLFGHLHFDMKVFGGYVGCDDPGLFPLNCAGGDITAIGTTLARKGTGAIMATRDDMFEVRGAMRLLDCNIIFDLTDESAGNADCPLVYIQSPSSAHDFGRDVYFPSQIEVRGNSIRFLGTTATPRAILLDVDTTRNASDNIILDTDIFVSDNSFEDESGLLQCRINGIRETNWTGAGLRARISNLPNLTIYWAARAGHATNTDARASWDVSDCGDVTLSTDYEATYRYDINCDNFTLSTAVGGTTAVGDEEWWHRIRSGLPQMVVSIADDAAISFHAGQIYATYMLVERNGGSSGVGVQFAADSLTSVGVTPHWSTGATIGTYTTALTGTDGADAQLNIGATGQTIYVENRTGGSLPLAVVKVQEG